MSLIRGPFYKPQNKIVRTFDLPSDFIAIDFETANQNRCSACALAITIVKSDEIVDNKFWYINPMTDYFCFTYIHNIKYSMVKDEYTLGQLWQKELKTLLEGNILVAHNASFDMSCLRSGLEKQNISVPDFDYIDTLKLVRSAYPNLPNHKLDTICKHLNIPLDHHNAASDSLACAKILLELKC